MDETNVLKDNTLSYADIDNIGKKLTKKNPPLDFTPQLQQDIDYTKLGYNISCYMGVYLEKSFLYKDAVKALKNIPEVVEIHAITGQYTIFIKILCKDTPHFREILDSKIHKVKGITRTESFMSIEETLKDGLSLN